MQHTHDDDTRCCTSSDAPAWVHLGTLLQKAATLGEQRAVRQLLLNPFVFAFQGTSYSNFYRIIASVDDLQSPILVPRPFGASVPTEPDKAEAGVYASEEEVNKLSTLR